MSYPPAPFLLPYELLLEPYDELPYPDEYEFFLSEAVSPDAALTMAAQLEQYQYEPTFFVAVFPQTQHSWDSDEYEDFAELPEDELYDDFVLFEAELFDDGSAVVIFSVLCSAVVISFF